ncbi:hypothetical protein ASG47_19815 [Devosia sp. Leaf420]|nr:hypothetical protein ASG47_19815 [Devosia sp. Leaf420]
MIFKIIDVWLLLAIQLVTPTAMGSAPAGHVAVDSSWIRWSSNEWQVRPDSPISLMEDWVPVRIEVSFERMPEEGEQQATSVFRPMYPAIRKVFGLECVKLPPDGRRTEHVLAQQVWTQRRRQAALLLQLTKRPACRRLVNFQGALYELATSKWMQER